MLIGAIWGLFAFAVSQYIVRNILIYVFKADTISVDYYLVIIWLVMYTTVGALMGHYFS